MTSEGPQRPGGAGSLTVAVVARLVGVAPSTLRTWARRYGLEPSGHRSGLHRRYSETDVARLRYMRSLTQSGMTSRDAATRAMTATLDELAATPGIGHPVVELSPAAALRSDRRPTQERACVGDVAPVVKTLLGTLGNADARGTISLLRIALRDLGAARTWDERVLPARAALWRLHREAQARGDALLCTAVVGAVGDVRLGRAPRNLVPVYLCSLPGHQDPAAEALLLAALAERSIHASVLGLGSGAATAVRAVSGAPAGVLVLQVPDDQVAAQLAGRLRQVAGVGEQLHWGEGWVRWAGHSGGMTDLVRAIEAASCPPPEQP
ncbi:MerR family transcriptional regulator [Arsenicicoccus dermatophilus]|uniref:MerR family transcriptional regulator n=1 Tax=Arsenicicoccus dermatophilus TaxID=1076331 RepID=UPI003916DFBD